MEGVFRTQGYAVLPLETFALSAVDAGKKRSVSGRERAAETYGSLSWGDFRFYFSIPQVGGGKKRTRYFERTFCLRSARVV